MSGEQTSAVAVREQGQLDLLRTALEDRADRIIELLPESMDPRRFMSVSLMALSKNPGLLECDRGSIVLAILEAAEVGLEPTGGVGGAHLVPFRDKAGKKHAQLIYDYRGVQYLIREGGGGEVKTVLVYEGDIFRVYEGTERPRIVHTRKFQTDEVAKVTYVYAVPQDHPGKFEVMTRAQVEAVRARSKSPNNGPWVTDWGPQARKTVLKRISAWLPLKPSARAALDRDTQREIEGSEDEERTPRATRTSEVRARIRENSGKRRQTPKSGPSAPEGTPDVEVTAPDDSAAQRTDDQEATWRSVDETDAERNSAPGAAPLDEHGASDTAPSTTPSTASTRTGETPDQRGGSTPKDMPSSAARTPATSSPSTGSSWPESSADPSFGGSRSTTGTGSDTTTDPRTSNSGSALSDTGNERSTSSARTAGGDTSTRPRNDATEGESREVCGANGTGVAEGEVCGLPPDHPEKVHKSETASWPVEGA